MNAYKYDAKGKYIGRVECQIDPLETKKAGKEIYLVPANSTTIAPPPEKEGFFIVWKGAAWAYEKIQVPPEPEPPTRDEQIAALTAEYTQEKANLCEAYTTATMQGDTETAQSVAADMADLDAWYDEEYAKIPEEEGSEDNG